MSEAKTQEHRASAWFAGGTSLTVRGPGLKVEENPLGGFDVRMGPEIVAYFAKDGLLCWAIEDVAPFVPAPACEQIKVNRFWPWLCR